MRIFSTLLLTCSLVLSGCSYALVKPPTQNYSPKKAQQRPLCTKIPAAPIADLALIAGGIAITASTADTSSAGGPIFGLGMMGGGIAGSIYGFQKTSDCRTLDNQFQQRNVASADTASGDSDPHSANTESDADTPETEQTPQNPNDTGSTTSNTTAADESTKPETSQPTATGSQSQSLLDRINKHVTVTASLPDLLEVFLQNYNDVPPFYGLGPTYEGMVEVNLPRQFAVSAFLGRGSMYLQDTDTDFARIRYGLQGIWYPIGDFKHGLQVGVHLQRNRAYGPEDFNHIPDNYQDVFSDNHLVSSTSLAPMLGYKVMNLTGFTFNVQAGFGPRILQQNVADRAVGLRDGPEVDPFYLGNLNFGWSF